PHEIVHGPAAHLVAEAFLEDGRAAPEEVRCFPVSDALRRYRALANNHASSSRSSTSGGSPPPWAQHKGSSMSRVARVAGAPHFKQTFIVRSRSRAEVFHARDGRQGSAWCK